MLVGCGAAPQGLPTEAPAVRAGAETEAARPACAMDDDTCRIDRLGAVRLDWLAEGLALEALEAKLGAPATREGPSEEGATGEWVTRVAWPDQGIEVLLSGPQESAPQTVRNIWLRAPSTLATDRGIRLGSTADEARAAYADALDPRAGEASIVAGSVYGGVIFAVEGGQVVGIFVGPAAE